VLDEHGSEQACSRAGVEDPLAPFEQTRADGSCGDGRHVVLRPGEVVVVDRCDPLVLLAELVEVTRTVETMQVDPLVGDG
jgi:hypothetical protein